MIDGGVKGRAELRKYQTRLRVAPQELQKGVRKRIRGALDPLKVDIPTEAFARMPKRGGYAALLEASTRVAIRLMTTGLVKATVRVSAMGKREERDVAARNRGLLRHPTFGNKSSAGWKTQRVRRGFVDDPMDAAKRRVVKATKEARDETAKYILRG